MILNNKKKLILAYYERKNIKRGKHITFIDQAMPYHQDQVRFGYKPIDKKYYFENLFKIFNYIKKVFQLDTHIIVHPSYKTKNLNSDYKYFTVKRKFDEKNKSLMNCKFVLAHHSSAILKGINYNKPIIQITSKKFNDFIKHYDYFFKKKFNLDRIYLEEKSENKIKKIIKQNINKKLNQEYFNLDYDNFKIFCKNIENFYHEK